MLGVQRPMDLSAATTLQQRQHEQQQQQQPMPPLPPPSASPRELLSPPSLPSSPVLVPSRSSSTASSLGGPRYSPIVTRKFVWRKNGREQQQRKKQQQRKQNAAVAAVAAAKLQSPKLSNYTLFVLSIVDPNTALQEYGNMPLHPSNQPLYAVYFLRRKPSTSTLGLLTASKRWPNNTQQLVTYNCFGQRFDIAAFSCFLNDALKKTWTLPYPIRFANRVNVLVAVHACQRDDQQNIRFLPPAVVQQLQPYIVRVFIDTLTEYLQCCKIKYQQLFLRTQSTLQPFTSTQISCPSSLSSSSSSLMSLLASNQHQQQQQYQQLPPFSSIIAAAAAASDKNSSDVITTGDSSSAINAAATASTKTAANANTNLPCPFPENCMVQIKREILDEDEQELMDFFESYRED